MFARIYPDPSVQIICVCLKDLKSRRDTCMSFQLLCTANIWQSPQTLVIHCRRFVCVCVCVCVCTHTRPIFNFDHIRQAGWIPLHLLNYRSWCLVMFVHYWEKRQREKKTKRKMVLICVSAWAWCIWPDACFNTSRETLSSIMAAVSWTHRWDRCSICLFICLCSPFPRPFSSVHK